MAEEQEQDFSKLSIEERCNHKNWKARLSGYESLTTLFQSLDDEKSPEFSKYAPLVKKLVIDSNAAAQEKGLSAVLAFAENYAMAGKYVEGVISGIVGKCLTSPKAKTKELSIEIVLMFVEIEKQELVIEELIKGLDNKTPKIVVASAALIKQCVNNYGVKVINIKPVVKTIPRLLEDRDKNVREEGKLLSIELYRWIKDALKPQLQNLKPVQLQELEAEFVKVKDERAVQTRLLRSQQAKAANEVATDQIDGNATSAVAQEEEAIDPYDLMEAVDVLSKIPNDFYELCEAKKWQERKEALDKLQELLEKNPRITSGDYGDLVRQLKKTVQKDTNIVVATVATKCLALLAAALRKSFHPYANSCVSIIIEKFKEKKQTVVAVLQEAIDAIIVATTLEAILEDITTALDNKNPQIKNQTALFLVRTLAKTHPNVLNKKLLKALCTSLIKTLSDMDSGVRDASAEALGTLMKVVGEKTLNPLLQGIEAIKMTKIKEFYDKAEVKIPATAVVSAPPPSKPPAVKRPPKANIVKSESQESLGASNEELNAPSKPVPKKSVPKPTAERARNGLGKAVDGSTSNLSDAASTQSTASKRKFLVKKNAKPTAPPTAKTTKKGEEVASNSPLMPLNKMKDQRIADEKALKVLKWNFTTPREEFYIQLKEQMISAEWQQNLINYCFHYDFKFHIKAIEQMKEYLLSGNLEATAANCDLILKWIALRFFDTNPSVILKGLEYLLLIFDAFHQNNISLSDSEANSLLPYLVLKAGDPKDAVRKIVHDIFSKLREIYAPSKIFVHLMTGLQSKNARQRMTCLEELANLIELCGLSVCQNNISITMKEIAKFIADRDNGVRNAALNCVVQVYFIEGERVYKHCGQLSDKESSLLEERIKRASKNRPPPPAPPQSAPAAVSKMVSAPNLNAHKPEPRTPSPPETGLTFTPRTLSSSKTMTRQRPKSMGPLSLNLDEIEQQMGSNIKRRTPPKNIGLTYRARDMYIEENNVDEILNLPDIQLKKRDSFGLAPKGVSSSPKADAEKLLNEVMTQLSSQDIGEAMQSLAQLSHLLHSKDDSLLSSKVDQLIIMCYMQYRLFLTKHLADQSITKKQAVELYRGITNVLMSLFSKQAFGPNASRDVLRELMSHLVLLLVDPKLTELTESKEIVRSVNVLVSTVINGSDPTNIITALIKLLDDCVGQSVSSSPKFVEMIMKCLWKICRNLDDYIQSLNVDKVLFEVHLFLKSFPSHWWKDNNRNDTPLRTIKTLTYLLVHQKGESIFNNLSLIQDRNDSELCHYLQKALKQSDRLVKTSSHNSSPLKSRTIHTQVTAILHKIESDENQNGMLELFDLVKTNPQISLDSALDKYPDDFKTQVREGLQRMRAERGLSNGSPRKSHTNGTHLAANSNGTPRRRQAYTRVPTPKDASEAVNWMRTAIDSLGLDPNRLDSEVLTQLNANDATINNIEAAERAVQRAQETLNRFKEAYASGQR